MKPLARSGQRGEEQMKRSAGRRAVDRALGSVGVVLLVLVSRASYWGGSGRLVIGLVGAVGWAIDRTADLFTEI